MALMYAFQDEAGTWYGEPDLPIDWPAPQDAPVTIIDDRSPFHGQTVTARLAATEGSRRGGMGSYVTLDNGYQLRATTYVEQLLFPWTVAKRFYGSHPGAAEKVPARLVRWD